MTTLELAWQEWLNDTTPHSKTQYFNETPFTYEFRRYGQAIALLEPKGDYIFITRVAFSKGLRLKSNFSSIIRRCLAACP